ncbi:MAG: DinB family protein [Chitinophagales bacterium]|nr:DinB family protein [Chitinophagales bacterium]
MKIARPNPDEYASHLQKYIDLVKDDEPVKGLLASRKEVVKLISGLSKKELKFRYEEGKWSIKEMLLHMMDTERVFAFRALQFSRNDKNELPGFEENEWAPASKADARKVKSLLKEYDAIREASIQLYSNLTDEMFLCTGIASKKLMSVRALLYVTLGHERHHLNVIKERYLNKSKSK